MAYKKDKDLEFLKDISSKDLDILVSVLTKDEKGKLRFTENLTYKEFYKKNYPDHHKYWDKIAEEIQCYGGNTIANTLRGGGVRYNDIVTDVCKHLKIDIEKDDNTEDLEMKLLLKILADATADMTKEELASLSNELGLKDILTSSITPMALQAAINLTGFMAYKIALIVANAVAKQLLGRGLSLVANAGLMRGISVFAGPIGWAMSIAWGIVDIAGPAMRVTMPTVIQVAFLRQQLKID